MNNPLDATKAFQQMQANSFPSNSTGSKRNPKGDSVKEQPGDKHSFRRDDCFTLQSTLDRDGVVKFEMVDKSKPIKEAISQAFSAKTSRAGFWISGFYQFFTTEDGNMLSSYRSFILISISCLLIQMNMIPFPLLSSQQRVTKISNFRCTQTVTGLSTP